MQTIRVSETIQLGIKKYKPEDEKAKVFCLLLRANTLSTFDINLIKRLDFKVELISNTPKEL